MELARPQIDVGIFTRQLEAMQAFYGEKLGLQFESVLPVGGGFRQHRYLCNGSVIKLMHSREPLRARRPGGYETLMIATPKVTKVEALPDPDGNTYQFFHTTPGVSLNWSGISNPQLDQLLEQTSQVTDQVQRKQLYSQAMPILSAAAPAVWEVHPVEPKALSPKLQGYTPAPDALLRFKDAWRKP